MIDGGALRGRSRGLVRLGGPVLGAWRNYWSLGTGDGAGPSRTGDGAAASGPTVKEPLRGQEVVSERWRPPARPPSCSHIKNKDIMCKICTVILQSKQVEKINTGVFTIRTIYKNNVQ